MQTTNCEALNIYYDRWATKNRFFKITLDTLGQILDKNRKAFEAVQNATSQILFELDTLRGRQAVSAAIQVVQFFLFVSYLFILAILYAVKKCRKHRAALIESEVELMESPLQDRKAKRRAAAAKKAGQETQ